MKRKRPKDGEHFRNVKMTLNQCLRRTGYRDAFLKWIEYWCHIGTIISIVASLLVLFKINRAFDDNDQQFFKNSGYNLIKECFRSVLKEYRHTLPLAFRQMIERVVPNFEWPERLGMGNAFNELYEQYTTNFKNNIKIWSYSRIRKFFKLKQYEINLVEGQHITDIDVKNATKAVMFNNITASENVNVLLEHAKLIGIPVGEKFIDMVKKHWFQTVPIFIHIQRQIFDYHTRYELINELWRQYWRDKKANKNPTPPRDARPPKIQNFRVVPLHDFKMKHIKIDIHLFYEFAGKLGALRTETGWFCQPKKVSKEKYEANLSKYWDEIFNMPKIMKVGGHKTFDFAFFTDGVGISLCFVKKGQPSVELTNEQINEKFQNNEFKFVLGMDPGVRTWNATVRKHIESGIEV